MAEEVRMARKGDFSKPTLEKPKKKEEKKEEIKIIQVPESYYNWRVSRKDEDDSINTY